MKMSTKIRRLKLSQQQYHTIGKIGVAAGLLEAEIRDVPPLLAKAEPLAGYAMTAHLNFSSLVQMSLAMLEHTRMGEKLRSQFDLALKACAAAQEDRNRIMHGPFLPDFLGASMTIRMTARRKIGCQVFDFSAQKLRAVLSELIRAADHLEVCTLMLLLERGEPLPPGALPPSHDRKYRTSRGNLPSRPEPSPA